MDLARADEDRSATEAVCLAEVARDAWEMVETDTAAIERARSDGVLAVEMEEAALYTFAAGREQPVVCFAHVTNQLRQTEEDFEKGEADGSQDALEVIDAAVMAWSSLD